MLPGVQAQFKFLISWKFITAGHLKSIVKLDCTTNDPDARTELWKIPGKNLTGVLPRDGDIYIINSATVFDAGSYRCRAFNKAGNTISKNTVLFLSQGKSANFYTS